MGHGGVREGFSEVGFEVKSTGRVEVNGQKLRGWEVGREFSGR